MKQLTSQTPNYIAKQLTAQNMYRIFFHLTPGSNTCRFLINAESKHTILPNKRRGSNKCRGHGTILTIEGKAKTKQRNYGDKANLADNLAVLDHSNGVFLVVLELCWQFFTNCRHPNSFIHVDKVAFNNTHFLVEPVVVLTHHVQSEWALIGGRRWLWFTTVNKCLALINTR